MQDIQSLLDKLHTGNYHLDKLVKVYFAYKIREPKLGNSTFKDVKHNFNYAIREYSITHSKKIEPGESPTLSKLLLVNKIPTETFELFKKKVVCIFQSHTDRNWSIDKKQRVLKKQLSELADEFEDNNTTEWKMHNKLNSVDPMDGRSLRFLNDLSEEMKKADLNQVKDDQYMIITQLITLYERINKSLISYEIKDKKKYLKKLDIEKAKIKLHGYIKEMMEDEYYNNPQDDYEKEYNESLTEKVRWFLFYLIYDANKIDIFMIHSILGYKYKGAVKVYQKIFLKDHSTGNRDEFSHHIDILSASESSFYDREHEAEYDKQLNEMIKYHKLKPNQVKDNKDCQSIIEDKMSKYNILYEHILQSMIE